MSLISQRGRRFRPGQQEEMPTSLPSTPLVSRIGHADHSTMRGHHRRGSALESRPDRQDCASSGHFECQSRCVSPGAELGVCGLVADHWHAAAQPGCGRRRSPVAACAGAEGGGAVDTSDGVGMQAASAGPMRSMGRARLAAGKTAGWAGRWLSRSPPRLLGPVIGPPTRRAGLNIGGHLG